MKLTGLEPKWDEETILLLAPSLTITEKVKNIIRSAFTNKILLSNLPKKQKNGIPTCEILFTYQPILGIVPIDFLGFP